jgi:hypothetical protein
LSNTSARPGRTSDWPLPLPDEAELASHWGRDCLFVERPQATRLFDLRSVRDVLCDGRTTSGHVTISTGDDFRNVDASEYTVGRNTEGHAPDLAPERIEPRRVLEFLRAGSSLILPNVQEYDHGVRRICRAVQARTGRPVEALAFLSPPGKGALPLHQDRVDVIVLQTAGTKHWQIFEHFPGQEGSGPVRKPQGAEPAYRFTLTPGDVCYMPANWPHRTRSDEDWSLHISISVSPIRLHRILDDSFHRALADIPEEDFHPAWDGSMEDPSPIDRAVENLSRTMMKASDDWNVRPAEAYRTHDEIAEVLGIEDASD